MRGSILIYTEWCHTKFCYKYKYKNMWNPLTSTTNMEVIYQVWGRLKYVKCFQLTSRIQHSIQQIWVCVRKVYANESICEAWVWLGECVWELSVGMHYHADVFFVVDMRLCVLMEYSPRIDTAYDNKHLWMDIWKYCHHWRGTTTIFTICDQIFNSLSRLGASEFNMSILLSLITEVCFSRPRTNKISTQ